MICNSIHLLKSFSSITSFSIIWKSIISRRILRSGIFMARLFRSISKGFLRINTKICCKLFLMKLERREMERLLVDMQLKQPFFNFL